YIPATRTPPIASPATRAVEYSSGGRTAHHAPRSRTRARDGGQRHGGALLPVHVAHASEPALRRAERERRVGAGCPLRPSPFLSPSPSPFLSLSPSLSPCPWPGMGQREWGWGWGWG